jgi:plasmid stabilization system protein ParE
VNFDVQLTEAAKEDLRASLRWLQDHSESGAEAWYRRWREILEILATRGGSLGLAPESEGHSEPIRQIIFRTRRGRPYRALFAVRQSKVFVLHIRGPGQDLLSPDQLV